MSVKEMKYSVLMSIYNMTTVDEMRLSVDSMLFQTVPPDEFIVICDGPIKTDVEIVLNEYCNRYENVFTVISLKENRGLAYALNKGIESSRNELIARMDSDDISMPERCEKQLKAFAEDKELALLGTGTADFTDIPENAKTSISPCPEDMDAIKRMIRRFDPFAHPTVMYKKSAVLSCGGYDPELRRRQDYDLFSKMVNRGYKAKNLNEPLLLYKVDENNFQRLKSKESCESRIKVQKRIYKRGECSFFDYMYIWVTMKVSTLMPMTLYKKIYDIIKRNIKN